MCLQSSEPASFELPTDPVMSDMQASLCDCSTVICIADALTKHYLLRLN